MRVSALLIDIAVVCFFAVACGPISTQYPVASSPAPALTCDRNSSGSDFVTARVSKLSASFDPTKGMPPIPGDIHGSVTPADPYWSDLVAAFTAATPTFKDKLCSLNGVFIVESTCDQTACQNADVINHSWGFRQQASSPQRYVATSASLWQGGSAPKFIAYEKMRLMAVLQALDPINGANWFELPNLQPQFKSASPDTTVMTVLAVLAHEYGHVLWYDEFVVNPNGTPNPGGAAYIQPSSALFCSGGFYTPNSWGPGNDSIRVPSTRWIEFGQRFPDQRHDPDLSGFLRTDLSQGNFANAAKDLNAIFLNGNLAGTLASFSAIEDFVETFEWFQLTNASPPLTDLAIQIDSLPLVNIVRWIASKPGVIRKMACFSS